ncbi:MAG: cadmium-translocating P-type ATPase [Oscillospiraceae bacterium]|nr:cadmium-translocating P-type ATPase [Oscillospiraceae bacterium]
MTEKIKLNVGKMSCVRCSAAVEKALKATSGVLSAEVSYASAKADIEFDPNATDIKKIRKAIEKAGYSVIDDPITANAKKLKALKIKFIISLIFALPFLVMMVLMLFAPNASITHSMHTNGLWQLILAIPVQFIIGMQFYIGAFHSLRNGSPSMDVLVSLGTTAAFGYSLYNLIAGKTEFYFEGAVVVITLILLGKTLETNAKSKTSSAISKLMDLSPKEAVVVRNGEEITIDAEKIEIGDIVIVKSGSNVAVDSVVVSGESSVDESMLTGESMPILKKSGDKVFGGTTNLSGALTIKAENVGSSTVLSEIVRMVETAQSSRANIQNIADKVSAVFVPAVCVISLVTLVLSLIFNVGVSESISRAVSVLVIACPCSLGLATPTALMVGIGLGAQNGILIKNADTLEKACHIKAVIFDKTGTITQGKPELNGVFTTDKLDKNEALKICASLERLSEHPLAKAVTKSYNGDFYSAEDFEEIAGFGIKAKINQNEITVGKAPSGSGELYQKAAELEKAANSVLYLTINGDLCAVFSVSDTIRETSKQAVSQLKDSGIRTLLITGDNELCANEIGKSIEIDEIFARVLPQDKLEKVKYCAEKYGITAMVGDGINDAPALAQSDVGFAMGTGTDVAMESGDIVLVGANPLLIPKAINLSQKTMRKIKQNLFWAFFYNSIGIPLAALGFLSPVIAGGAMAFSSVSVVTNSLLLKRTKL